MCLSISRCINTPHPIKNGCLIQYRGIISFTIDQRIINGTIRNWPKSFFCKTCRIQEKHITQIFIHISFKSSWYTISFIFQKWQSSPILRVIIIWNYRYIIRISNWHFRMCSATCCGNYNYHCELEYKNKPYRHFVTSLIS